MDYKNLKNVTFGAEHEFGDVCRRTKLPDGMSWSRTEFDIVSSCGTAIDPSGKAHTIGGEVNTPPTSTIEEQVELFKTALRVLPNATINHRGHLHTHISFDGLKTDLDLQKKILKYVRYNSPQVFMWYFKPTRHPEMNNKAYAYQIIDRSIMPIWKANLCYSAKTIEDFKLSHAKVKDGRILYQTMKRYAFNLYSIFKHGTIELRCIYPTLDPEEVEGVFMFLRDFINEAVCEGRPLAKWMKPQNYKIPREQPYNKFIEESWQKNNYKK